MATRWINPPNTPAPQTPAPQAPTPRPLTARPLTSQPVRPQSAPRGPASKDAPADKNARVSGQPQATPASTTRVTRPPQRAGSDESGSQDHAPNSTRQFLFDSAKPVDGLPPPRSPETVAILQALIDLLPTLDGSLAEFAREALLKEIASHRALMARGHEGVAG